MFEELSAEEWELERVAYEELTGEPCCPARYKAVCIEEQRRAEQGRRKRAGMTPEEWAHDTRKRIEDLIAGRYRTAD